MNHARRLSVWIGLAFLLTGSARAQSFDVVVAGGTPGGISAAVTAARLGRTVALVEYYPHLGGMTTSGLGKSDVITKDAIGGLWDEFTRRVLSYYGATYGAGSKEVTECKDGYYYEPSVAESILNAMISEQKGITVFLRHRIDEVVRSQRRVTAIRIRPRDSETTIELRGKVFIDATYEGDLAAWAGARYRLGRESRQEFDEPHAGVIYMDHTTRALLPGSSGEGDDRLPAYTYRLCLSADPNNRVLPAAPPDYDRRRYVNYLLDLKLGRLKSAVEALSISAIPHGKFDANMKPWPLGFPFAEENKGYPDGSWEEREKIMARIRNITLGLVYFIQNDPEVPAADRERARQYGLAKDEFADNANFPFQFYVREARRIIGETTLTERDLTSAPESVRAPLHADSICAGEYPIDAFPTRKYEPGHETALEGYILMLKNFTRPYQIPYGIIVPADVDGLLVPVAASTTHIAFSSVRLEPTWVALGQAAGTAAHLAIELEVEPRKVPIERLQRDLIGQGQVLTYFEDVPKGCEDFASLQYLGAKGFFPEYSARRNEPLTNLDAETWASKVCALAGKQVGSQNRKPASLAPNAPITPAAFEKIIQATAGELGVKSSGHPSPRHDTVLRRDACVRFDGLLKLAGR